MIPDQQTFDGVVGLFMRKNNIDPAHLFDAIREDETIAARAEYAQLWANFARSAPYQAWLRRRAVIDSLRSG